MNPSLPPIPTDLWPKVIAVTGRRPVGRMLTLEIPGLSESSLLTALSRSVHLDMRAAGEWAARIGSASDKDFPSARAFARYRAEEAARLMAIYAALYGSAQYLASSDLTPEALKASASRSYQLAWRDERERTHQPDGPSAPPLSSPVAPNLHLSPASVNTPSIYEHHPKIRLSR